jgi:hypothetical protein
MESAGGMRRGQVEFLGVCRNVNGVKRGVGSEARDEEREEEKGAGHVLNFA